MDKKRLIEILSIPSHTKKEEWVREYIISFADEHGIEHRVDDKGNLYLIKGELGEGESYPCVVAHMDTVHSEQADLVDSRTKLIIEEETKETDNGPLTILYASHPTKKIHGINMPTGIGGDDKAGVVICLELMLKFDKIIGAFFVEEETGCWGSKEADEEILKEVGYFIQFDAPSDNWISKVCAGVQLFDESFENRVMPLLESYGQTNIRKDPYTDVAQLKIKFDVPCINIFAGYYRMHSPMEFVVIEHMEKALALGEDIIKEFGKNKYQYIFEGRGW